jgi:pimeloyl-ACP methyl ester carboxylesterase
MPELDGIVYTVAGSGPGLVVPQCNVDWSAVDLSPLAERFTVVTVSPRGFGTSARRGGYTGAGMVADVESVLDHLGIDGYVALGYSMSGAMASRLGVDNPRVRAVACGGFPTTGGYGDLPARMRGILEQIRGDPESWAELVAAHDPLAVLAFYDDLAGLPPGALVDRLSCPVHSWWGGADERIEELGGIPLHLHGLAARGLHFEVLPGLDHEGALERIDLALPGVLHWLEGLDLTG